jgi:hypothetical protein
MVDSVLVEAICGRRVWVVHVSGWRCEVIGASHMLFIVIQGWRLDCTLQI